MINKTWGGSKCTNRQNSALGGKRKEMFNVKAGESVLKQVRSNRKDPRKQTDLVTPTEM